MAMEDTVNNEIIIHKNDSKVHALPRKYNLDEEFKAKEKVEVSSSSLYGNMVSKDIAVAIEAKVKIKRKMQKIYPCEKCNLISQSSTNFKKHMLTHSGEKPHKCMVCQRAFRQKHHLIDHQRTHTGERPFECEECGSRFVQKSSLNLHRKKHSGIKPYSCNICNHSTYEKMHLKMHMRTHTGEKPYQCEKCGQTFSHLSRLKLHTMIHTGERRYKCEKCGVCFREKVTLQKHRGVHINLGPFECEECGKQFTRMNGLVLHRKVHTNNQEYLYVYNKSENQTYKSTLSEMTNVALKSPPSKMAKEALNSSPSEISNEALKSMQPTAPDKALKSPAYKATDVTVKSSPSKTENNPLKFTSKIPPVTIKSLVCKTTKEAIESSSSKAANEASKSTPSKEATEELKFSLFNAANETLKSTSCNEINEDTSATFKTLDNAIESAPSKAEDEGAKCVLFKAENNKLKSSLSKTKNEAPKSTPSKSVNEPLKDKPSKGFREVADIENQYSPLSEIMPRAGDKVENISTSALSLEHNDRIYEFTEHTGSTAVLSEEQASLKNVKYSQPSIDAANISHISSVFDDTIHRKINVVHSSEEGRSQDKLKESLASNLYDKNVTKDFNVVHPDHVRAALESGTVLETQDEDGKGFFIVLPESLKDKEITYLADSMHNCDIIRTSVNSQESITDVTIDVPTSENTIECNSSKVFSHTASNNCISNDPYSNVAQDLPGNDVCAYTVDIHEVTNVEDDNHPIQIEGEHNGDDGGGGDIVHNYDSTDTFPVEEPEELNNEMPRYPRVVREEIYSDGTSLLLWNDELEHLTEVTYVIEEGKENPILNPPQGAQFYSSQILHSTVMEPEIKRKAQETEFFIDDINQKNQKMQKCDYERTVSAKTRTKDKKLKEKKVKSRMVYDCLQCGKSCKTSSNYITHMRTHSGERPYFCDFCGMGFKQISHLRSHIRIHTGERPYVCNVCNATFTQSSRLNSHKRTIHVEGRNIVKKKEKPLVEHKVRNFYCKICKKTFINECFKIDHMRGHLKPQPYRCKICGVCYKQKSSMIKHSHCHVDNKFICEICGHGFLNLSMLENHSIVQHKKGLTECGMSDVCINVKIGEEKDFVVINHSIKNIQSEITDGVKVKEETIDITEVNDCQVKQEVIHVIDADGCVKCEVMPVTHVDDMHIKAEAMEIKGMESCSKDTEKHSNKDYVSSTEEQSNNDNISSTEEHSNKDNVSSREEHSNEDNVSSTEEHSNKNNVSSREEHSNKDNVSSTEIKCEVLLTVDKDKELLNILEPEWQDSTESVKEFSKVKFHYTSIDNTGRKIWQCKVCDRPFYQSSNYQSHMRMHTGERPYECNYCPRAFKQITHLKDHMSRHTGLKPYKCGACGLCFSQRSAVTRHIRNLHNDKAIMVVMGNDKLLPSGWNDLISLKLENQSGDSEQHLQEGEINSSQCKNKKLNDGSSSNKTKTCDICKQSYTINYFRSHLRCHTGERPYTCNLCGETFRQKAHMHSHQLRHSREKSVCELCGTSFTQSYRYDNHIIKCRETKNVNTKSIKKYRCACGTCYIRRVQLVRHQKICSVVKESYKRTDINEPEILFGESESKCELNGNKNLCTSRNEKETKKQTESSPMYSDEEFTCKYCNITFKNITEHKNHLKQHENMSQVCGDCGALFRRASALRFHQRVKHGKADERYKEYNIGLENIKEEQFSDDNIEEDKVKHNKRHINNNIEESKGNIKQEKLQTYERKGITGKRCKNHLRESVGKVTIKSLEEMGAEKNTANSETLQVAERKHEMEAPGGSIGKEFERDSQKNPGDEQKSQAVYKCEACVMTFNRLSKLKHHIGMWCKGLKNLSQHNALSDSSNNVLKQEVSLDITKIKQTQFPNFDIEFTKKSSLVTGDSNSKNNSKLKGTKNIKFNHALQSEELVAVKVEENLEGSDSIKPSEVRSTSSEEEETKSRIFEDKQCSNSNYCKDCDKHFTRAYSYKVHLQTHLAKRPYKCDRCCVTFTQKAHLTTHYRRHTGETPYQCDACDKAFTQSSRLKDHIKRLHGKPRNT
ncbi:zinc finger protein Xfin [Procambarus clarkii]|uniref:zinc finger protein Xfin n=1 Tax=Procambarus clarkii TaxID=6728 RepID=UPI001E674FC0|nr:uncharacterized protein LOC123769261 [Procambarus clarkii]XP_045616300.1 uncharacterized protein LOC123769261 [Procambarus clarkii]